MSHDFAKHFTFSMFALILGLVALRGAVTGILAWLIGASPWESRGLATMQLLGGAIELAIVKLGVDRGIASEELLTAVALHVMISVAGVPWLLKRLKGETPQVLSLLEAASPFVGRVKPTGRRITPQKLLSRVIGKWAKTPAVRAECLTSEHLLHLLRGKERHGGVIGKTALRFAFAKGLKSPLLSAISFPSEVTWGDRHQKIELLLIIIWPQPETTRLEYATYAEIEDAVQILDDRYRSEFIGLLSPSTNDSSTEFEVPPGMLNDSAVSPALGKETLPKVNYEAALRLLCHGRELSHED